MDYAEPSTPRPRWLPSIYIAFVGIVLSAFLIFFVDSTYGSGVIRPNPFRVWPAFAVWALAVLYVWQRVREDMKWPCFGLILVGIGTTAGVVLLPIQLIMWREDVGHPQSRWRLDLMWPLGWTLVAVVVAAVGRALTRRRGGLTSLMKPMRKAPSSK